MQDGERKVSRGEFVSDFLPRREPWCCAFSLYLVPFLPPLQMCHPTTPPQVLVLPFREMCPRIQLCRAPSCCTRRWGPATKKRRVGKKNKSVAGARSVYSMVLPVREPPVPFEIFFSAEISRIFVFFLSFTAEEAIHHTIAESR